MHRTTAAGALATAFAFAVAAPLAAAQDQAALFAGRTVTIVVGYPPGGGFDLAARMLVQHMGRFIPGNPNLIAQNMPGASSFKASNYVYNVVPKDGTFLGALDSTIPLAQKLTGQGRFEPEKFYWIGRLAADDSVGLSWHTSGIRTIEDARKKEVAMSAGGAMGPASMIGHALNRVAGTKFKMILGYRGSSPMVAAMEQGEVGAAGTYGFTALKTLKKDWLDNKRVNLLYVVSYERNPEIPDVPALPELGRTELDKKVLRMITARSVVGRSYVAPPGVDAARGAALRKAFDAMVTDKGFLADMKKRNFLVSPATGDQISKVVADVVNADAALVERTRWATAPDKGAAKAKTK
jgi:tripartite-type tricarboxylate transporter receptor subunit TctC